jgi:hypothetical protein
MLTHLSKSDDAVAAQAQQANAGLPKTASNKDAAVHIYTGSTGAHRPKHSVGVGRIGSVRPAVPAYQRIEAPPMNVVAARSGPMYFEDLCPLLRRYQVLSDYREGGGGVEPPSE